MADPLLTLKANLTATAAHDSTEETSPDTKETTVNTTQDTDKILVMTTAGVDIANTTTRMITAGVVTQRTEIEMTTAAIELPEVPTAITKVGVETHVTETTKNDIKNTERGNKRTMNGKEDRTITTRDHTTTNINILFL